MTKSQRYFLRNCGEWNWSTNFKVTSWKKFFQSGLPLHRKILFLLFLFSQKLFGRYRMWTRVVYKHPSDAVKHETRLIKFGTIFMKSLKTFQLNPDGNQLTLQGVEFFWPFLSFPNPFSTLQGRVDDSTTRAFYQMPIFGEVCECKAILEFDHAEIQIHTSWLKGSFCLTPGSMEIFRPRFKEFPPSSGTAF